VKLVVFKFNHLGDNVVFVSAIQAIRQTHPDYKITLLTTLSEAALYGGPFGPQEILFCPKRVFDGLYKRPWLLAWWIWRIRRRDPDACLVPFDQGSVAHLIAKFSGAKVRIGAKLERARIHNALTKEISLPEDLCPATWNWRMVQDIVMFFDRTEEWPAIPPPPNLEHLLSKGAKPAGKRRRVVIHSGASRYLNQWGLENFAEVARSLSTDFEVVWINHGGTTGTPPDGTIAATVHTISELAEWLVNADLFLGNNSGPMHLANGLGCPGVVVTGPSAIGWNPYWHRERWTVLRHPKLYCAPCEVLTKKLPGCANIESPMACLIYWTVESVSAACRERLNRQAGGRS
jgi:ADP-heptose:LPS heptosyltransferase